MAKKEPTSTAVSEVRAAGPITLKTWPMRPGFKHLGTLQNIIASVDLKTIQGGNVNDIIKAVKVDEIGAKYGTDIVALIADGSNLSQDEIESLSIADIVTLVIEIAGLNVRPMTGLFSRLKKSGVASSTQPQA